MKLIPAILTACLLSVAATAHAGVILRVQNEDAQGQQVDTNEMKIDGNRMRTDSTGRQTMSMIFLGDTDEMYMIDHKEKTYMVMDRETIEAMANRMSEAMKQMEEALKNVPPEQREMVERMMKGQMKGIPTATAPRSEPVVKSLGQSDNVSGIRCDWKEVTRDDVLELKACVCDWKDIPGGDDFRQISMEMKDFSSAILDSLSSLGGAGGLFGAVTESPIQTMALGDGVPLITENYEGSKLIHRTRFQSIEETAISAEEFVPPKGYKKRDLAKELSR